MRPPPALLLALALVAGCGGEPAAPPVTVRMSTTTSTRDSGLLEAILPALERDTGVSVAVLAVGSGQALRHGRDGDADILVTHDPRGEMELVADGAVVDRRPLMYNDFVIVGPAADPAGIGGKGTAAGALRSIAGAAAPFLSRGDDSGTHRKERRLFAAAGIDTGGEWYRESGQGMGATLTMAAEMGAYTLTDRATLSAHGDAARLPILLEGDPELRNPYAVMLVNPERHPHLQAEGARRVEEWLTGERGRRAIEAYRLGGKQVFFLLSGD